MKKATAIIVGLVILGVLILFSMTFAVAYNQVAIRSTFGKVDQGSIIREPGLHFRLPFFADSVPAETVAAMTAAVLEVMAKVSLPIGVNVLRNDAAAAMAIAAVKAGQAGAAVSAGNTGALMAMAKLALRTMPGVDRPALAAMLPTLRSCPSQRPLSPGGE